ncbi:MAG: hypothetical protein JO306_10180 [Gemmatimonadetes bacterium]|nr:hypothetical protein [Gemmatimonadota bacterium]
MRTTAACMALAGLLAAAPAAAQRGPGSPGGRLPEPPPFHPARFVPAVTNPWFPLAPGTTWRYAGTGSAARESGVVTVMDETKTIQGVRATVVRDLVFRNGRLVEDTRDWYAQDRDGNVWYLGESTRELRGGRVASTGGSWEAGAGGARAGIVMWADPAAHVGEAYRQEYLPGKAEDVGRVVALRPSATVGGRTFRDCVETEDTSPLEPAVRERKLYCRGAGLVRESESPRAGSELVSVETP